MNIIQPGCKLTAGPQDVCLAVGVFDGVHLGHQQVLRQAVADAEQFEARAVAVTFDCHPNTVVAADHVPPLIYSIPQKLRAIAALGADSTLIIHFDKAFSRKSGEQFIRSLATDFGRIRSVCVGNNFTFGYKRSGNVALLQTLGQEMNFGVHGLASVSLDGQAVSSTRIRETIRDGQFAIAGQMLGRGYALAGEVIRGDGLGRQLGFPTANIEVSGRVLPPQGVYAVHTHGQGKSQRAVLNVGSRPTVALPTSGLRLEVHLLDFEGDLYGQELEITFVEKLRDEKKFPSVGALREQIIRDIEAARALFGSNPSAAGQ